MIPPSFHWHVEYAGDGDLHWLVLSGHGFTNRCAFAAGTKLADELLRIAVTRLGAWAWIRFRDLGPTVSVHTDDGELLRVIAAKGAG